MDGTRSSYPQLMKRKRKNKKHSKGQDSRVQAVGTRDRGMGTGSLQYIADIGAEHEHGDVENGASGKQSTKPQVNHPLGDLRSSSSHSAASGKAPGDSTCINRGGGRGDDRGGGKKRKKRRRQEAAASRAAMVQTVDPCEGLSRQAKAEPGTLTSRSGDKATSKRAKADLKAHSSSGSNKTKVDTAVGHDGSSPLKSAAGGRKGSSGDGSKRAKTRGGAAGLVAAPRLSELQKRMRQKLEGAQFRMINEALYTSESRESLAKFKEEPELFDVYHRGFREQVEKWPVHPLDIIIGWLRKYPKARVADFGCGEARLAATVPNKVHSFDLVSPNPRVTACDMAHVPLKNASVQVAVFCLSLMGTNLADFLREAHRVLVPGGLIKVAEVRSRFEGEEGGVERFLDVAKRLGFDCKQMERSNKMFLMTEFKKSARKPEKGIEFEAKACIYKRR